jgi:monothiol glutaredoxin
MLKATVYWPIALEASMILQAKCSRILTLSLLLYDRLMMDTLERIKLQIANNPLLLYMKGTPQFPQCGFSGQVAQILKLCKAKYAYVNILENPDIRQTLPQYANWPTFPQLYLNGELIGGCDIVTELFEQGDLQKQLSEAGVTAENMEAMAAQE